MRFVIVDKNFITPNIRGGNKERPLLNDQAIIRVNSKNEELLKNYIKFTEDEIRSLNLNTKLKIRNTYGTDNSNLTRATSEKPSGDYNSIVSHNFCDNNTWPSTDNSVFEVKPPIGKIWHIDRSEAQFSDNFDLGDKTDAELILEYYIWLPDGSEFNVQTITFDSIYRLFEIGNEHFYCPPKNISTLKFNQPVKLSLYGDQKTNALSKMVIKTKNNVELTGNYGTVSMVSINE
jgi:hypothetical protein